MAKRKRTRPTQPPPDSTESDASWYDKIVKENLKPTVEVLIRRDLKINFQKIEYLPITKQQVTLEREPDFICKVFSPEYPDGVILHVEFESGSDPTMADRMLLNVALERKRYKLEVLPFAIYIGSGSPNIPTTVRQKGLDFEFTLIYLNRLPFEDFANSDLPEDVVMAILTDPGSRTPDEILDIIINRLIQLVGKTYLLNKFLNQLRVMSRLRNLQPETEKKIADMILSDFKIHEDFLYIKGMNEGIAKGKAEGLEEGLELGADNEIEIATFNMLDLNFKTELIAGILSTTEAKILEIKKRWELLQKIKSQVEQGIKKPQQIAKNLDAPLDLVKSLLEKLNSNGSKKRG